MSQRLLRVCELLKRELGGIIARDYDFNALVTINAVDVTPDLRNGHVFVGIIGGEGQAEKIVDRLNRDHGMIQKRMTKRVVLKYTPQLHFKLDDSVERGVRTVNLLQELEAAEEFEDEEEGDLDPENRSDNV